MMSISTAPSFYSVLCLAGHGGPEREQALYGGSLSQRMLNINGRWVAEGSATAPLLVWSSVEVAEVDAAKATEARRKTVVVRQVGGTDIERFITPFGPAHAPALLGYLPVTATAARKLEADRKKLMGYVSVMLAAGSPESEADAQQAMTDMKAAAHKLRLAGIGNGSWMTAAQGLTGKWAVEMASRVFDGELACDPGIAPADVLKAMLTAKRLAR